MFSFSLGYWDLIYIILNSQCVTTLGIYPEQTLVLTSFLPPTLQDPRVFQQKTVKDHLA